MERPDDLATIEYAENVVEKLPQWTEHLREYQEELQELEQHPETFRSKILGAGLTILGPGLSKSILKNTIDQIVKSVTDATNKLRLTDNVLRPVMMEFKEKSLMYPHQKLVLASSHHPRLGDMSNLSRLDESVLRMISDMLDPSHDMEFFGLDHGECMRWMEYARIRGLLD